MTAAARPLVMVEVIPLTITDTRVRGTDADGTRHPFRTCTPISTPSAKLQLLNMGRQGMFSEGWLDSGATENAHRKEKRSNDKNYDVKSNSTANHETNSTRSRGLWLKSALHSGSKCDLSHTFDQTIISGDLIFQGKNACTNQQRMKSKCTSSLLYVTYLRSDDPLDQQGVPCYLRGYIFAENECLQYFRMSNHRCVVTTGTIVQICPILDVSNHRDLNSSGLVIPKSTRDFLHATLSGRLNVSQQIIHSRSPQSHLLAEGAGMEQCAENRPRYSALSCYDKQTVDSLSLRMSTMLANTVWIGTSQHALSMRKDKLQELELMDQELRAFWTNHANHDGINPRGVKQRRKRLKAGERSSAVPLLLREGALLVHNSHPNSGKSTLVAAIANDELKCDAVHVISAPALFAKYGTSADAALESVLHELALRCAVKGGATVSMDCFGDKERQRQPKVCVILDHLETFLPLSRQAGGDPYSPVLNAMTAHLNRLSFSFKTRNEFPFPSNNPLYNACHTSRSSPGFTLPLGICLVGVMTCSEGSGKRAFQSALEALGGGRFRVPLPSATTRLSAFRQAFEVCGVELTIDAKKALPEICATFTWASGGSFLQCAKRLRSELTRAGVLVASEQDLKRAMIQARNQSKYSTSSYTADFPALSRTAKEFSFSSVGGNLEAKLALEDALALSPRKQHLLSKLGLKLPTGVLLYGPPGTGKTLLARAVAQSLYQQDHMDIENAGGAFVSLKASDIVRPEVGISEKLIVSAFETARRNSPSVIFIDEFQALFGDRDGGGFILGQLSSTLLQCMDDIARWSEVEPPDNELKPASAKNGRIVILGATNAPWAIDKAFLRPGRFDRAVHVKLPSVNDSEEILRVHVSRMKLAPQTDQVFPVDEICKSLAELCLGYSGADLAALCRSASVRCLSSGAGEVTKQHFLDARLYDVMRSSNDNLVKRISAWQP